MVGIVLDILCTGSLLGIQMKVLKVLFILKIGVVSNKSRVSQLWRVKEALRLIKRWESRILWQSN